ncbi:MAG: DNA replication terminus site-binding protein [Chloroflexia bacterium]|nr:DNA replication terminus site-binding protein [Chloroflexia bacterium]
MNLIYKITIIFLISLGFNKSFAADETQPYAVSRIPKVLLLNANAVIRNNQMIQTIENINQSKIKIKRTITLLNEKASDYRFSVFHTTNS